MYTAHWHWALWPCARLGCALMFDNVHSFCLFTLCHVLLTNCEFTVFHKSYHNTAYPLSGLMHSIWWQCTLLSLYSVTALVHSVWCDLWQCTLTLFWCTLCDSWRRRPLCRQEQANMVFSTFPRRYTTSLDSPPCIFIFLILFFYYFISCHSFLLHGSFCV